MDAILPTVFVRPDVSGPDTVFAIEDFSLTSDSVTVTATIRTDPNATRIRITWGDGTELVRDIEPTPGGVTRQQLGNSLPPNTYAFEHVYQPDPTEEIFDLTKKFFRRVTAYVRTPGEPVDTRSERIEIIPRYRMEFFPINFRRKSSCDLEGGKESFKVTLIDGEQGETTQTSWSFSFDGPVKKDENHVLTGSQYTQEVTPANREVGIARFAAIVEYDLVADERGTANLTHAFNDPPGERAVTVNLEDFWSFDCDIELSYYFRSVLVAPRKLGPPTVFA